MYLTDSFKISSMKFLAKLIFYALAIWITSYLLPGVEITNYWTAFILAGLLALFNVTLKPLLVILTIPFTIITLGLFLIVINGGLILLAGWVIDGVEIANFWWAVLFSFIVSILNSLFIGINEKNK